MLALAVCRCWYPVQVFPLGMPNGCRLCQEKDRSRCARGSGIPMSLITEGRLCRGTWENLEVETVPDWVSEQSFDSPELQTSAVRFHSDQRAQPQFQACKHSETSAAESMIFPLRVFQVDILKQTPPCCWPHLWPLELWPFCVHMCPGLREK